MVWTQQCTKCKQVKCGNDFGWRKERGYAHTICRDCINAKAREFLQTPEGKAWTAEKNRTPAAKARQARHAQKLSRILQRQRMRATEKYKAARKARTLRSDFKPIITAITDRYRNNPKNKIKLIAHGKAKRLKKQPCEMCGSTNKVHAHHSDYAKPLEVRWFCPTHHKAWHRLFLAENAS